MLYNWIHVQYQSVETSPEWQAAVQEWRRLVGSVEGWEVRGTGEQLRNNGAGNPVMRADFAIETISDLRRRVTPFFFDAEQTRARKTFKWPSGMLRGSSGNNGGAIPKGRLQLAYPKSKENGQTSELWEKTEILVLGGRFWNKPILTVLQEHNLGHRISIEYNRFDAVNHDDAEQANPSDQGRGEQSLLEQHDSTRCKNERTPGENTRNSASGCASRRNTAGRRVDSGEVHNNQPGEDHQPGVILHQHEDLPNSASQHQQEECPNSTVPRDEERLKSRTQHRHEERPNLECSNADEFLSAHSGRGPPESNETFGSPGGPSSGQQYTLIVGPEDTIFIKGKPPWNGNAVEEAFMHRALLETLPSLKMKLSCPRRERRGTYSDAAAEDSESRGSVGTSPAALCVTDTSPASAANDTSRRSRRRGRHIDCWFPSLD